MNTEQKYIQMVMAEMAALGEDREQIRSSFAPGTETHTMISTLAFQKQCEPRKIIEAAVRTFYVAWMMGGKSE